MAPCSRLMSLTEAEFLRLIPRAVSPFKFSMNPNAVMVDVGQGRVRIVSKVRPGHKIASLALPVLQVDIVFEGLGEVAATQFLARFDRAFHRGGG